MNESIDLKKVRDEAVRLHKMQKVERQVLRDVQAQKLEQLETKHAKERREQPQSAELIARQKAEVINSANNFARYEKEMNARHQAEHQKYALEHDDGALTRLEFEDRLREMEVRHEQELDGIKQRHEQHRIDQKFRHLHERNAANQADQKAVLERQRALEGSLMVMHERDLIARYERHRQERVAMSREITAALAREDQARREKRREDQRAAEQARNAGRVNDPRVIAMAAVIATQHAHSEAEKEHKEAMERVQKAAEQQEDNTQSAGNPPAPPLNPEQEFARKSRATEELAVMRNQLVGNFDEAIDNARGRAKVFAAEAGQDEGLDAFAKQSVEEDWIPKEFDFAQAEIGRREAALHAQLEKINGHLEPADKIRIGRDYQPIKGEDGQLHNPSLDEINTVADRLDTLFQAEQRAREYELAHPEWVQDQKIDEREMRMAEVSAKIEQHRAAEDEHKAEVDQDRQEQGQEQQQQDHDVEQSHRDDRLNDDIEQMRREHVEKQENLQSSYDQDVEAVQQDFDQRYGKQMEERDRDAREIGERHQREAESGTLDPARARDDFEEFNGKYSELDQAHSEMQDKLDEREQQFEQDKGWLDHEYEVQVRERTEKQEREVEQPNKGLQEDQNRSISPEKSESEAKTADQAQKAEQQQEPEQPLQAQENSQASAPDQPAEAPEPPAPEPAPELPPSQRCAAVASTPAPAPVEAQQIRR